MSRLRIAILCHSVNPRGGVVHAVSLAEALAGAGHEAVVHAPDPGGAGFFRTTACRTVSVPAARASGGLFETVEAGVAAYLRHFDEPANARFDAFHAQDGLSGAALAALKATGRVRGYARTVHHIDAFADPRLGEIDRRSIVGADARFVVSRMWRDRLAADYDLASEVVGNGVDASRFTGEPDGREPTLRLRLGLGAGPVILSIGGVEKRKNTRRILEAFRQVERIIPGARLVIAGGASLIDHSEYRACFNQELASSGLPPDAVVLAGRIADADMPALYRLADLLAFPSTAEGFGLVVLEAMASGLPVVAPRIAPFTEYLGDDEAAWCDPLNPGSIANATMAALAEPLRSRLAGGGRAVAARHGWARVAESHLPAYHRLAEPAHA